MEEYECTKALRWLVVKESHRILFDKDGIAVGSQAEDTKVLQQAWVGKHSGDVDWRDVPTKIGE